MIRNRKHGLTLVELLMVTAIMGILSVAAAGLLTASLQAYDQGSVRLSLQREGLLAMERMTDAARVSTHVLVPNAHATSREMLALSGLVNDDADFYFGDPLFPRIDEDLAFDMDEDGKNGIAGVDEDGDAQVDEESVPLSGYDDDEDGVAGEDPLNGIDDDGDGNFDEDVSGDMNGDGAPGFAGIDDDGDGQVDEGNVWDDDEDGTLGESGLHPIVFRYESGTSSLIEWNTATGDTTTLSAHVAELTVLRLQPELLWIRLVLTDGEDSITFTEHVCLRNAMQRTGKRVR